MREKYYEFTSFVLMGIILILLGIFLLIGKNITYQYLTMVLSFVIWMNSFRELGKFVFRKLNKKEGIKAFSFCLFHLVVCVILIVIPNFLLEMVPLLFSIYLVLIGFTQLIMCFLLVKNRELIRLSLVFIAIFCFSISFSILKERTTNLDTFLSCLAIYSLLLGGSMLWDGISNVLSKKTKNQLKRHIRITLPKIVEAIIPYSVMIEINRNLVLDKKQIYSFDKKKMESDLNILIHTSSRGFNRMGHIDLCFEHHVISFGNYDEGSRIYKDFFGDGVLFITDNKKEYINFCIDNSKKTIFDFGITLNKSQKKAIQTRIREIMANAIEWDYRSDKKYNNGTSYAAKLYKSTNAKFYKFNRGKYCTYFVLGMNCCFLVDDIVGKSGMDIVSINGIITPGTYYDYLNRELKLRNSNVISKDIYNFKRRT